MKNVFSYKQKCLRVGSLGLTGGPLSAAGPGHDRRRAPSIASERVGPPVRPILKHEPRSLANMRVAGSNIPVGAMKVKAGRTARAGSPGLATGVPPACPASRRAQRTVAGGGGARARSQGPERW